MTPVSTGELVPVQASIVPKHARVAGLAVTATQAFCFPTREAEGAGRRLSVRRGRRRGADLLEGA